jgi:hypothetical protein
MVFSVSMSSKRESTIDDETRGYWCFHVIKDVEVDSTPFSHIRVLYAR